MSEENRNIEDFFKKRLESKEFLYEEADWQKLNDKMDASGLFLEGGSFGISTVQLISLIGLAIVGSFLAGWYMHDQVEQWWDEPRTTAEQSFDNPKPKNPKNNTPMAVVVDQDTAKNLASVSTDANDNNDQLGEADIPMSTKTDPVAKNIERVKSIASYNEKEKLVEPEVTADSQSSLLVNEPEQIQGEIKIRSIEAQSEVSKEEEIISVGRTERTIEGNISDTITLVSNQGLISDVQNSNSEETEVQIEPEGRGLPIDSVYENSNQAVEEVVIAEAKDLNGKNNEKDSPENNSNAKQPLVYARDDKDDATTSPTQRFSKYGRFSIGLSVSPDFNSVGFGNKSTASVRPGMHIYYRINRVRLSTGVLFNKKQYETSAEGYRVPYGYWSNRTNGVVPSLISGYCRVVDIPVNVSYDFIRMRKMMLGASAGISSYILLNEGYDFEFETANPGAATNWRSETNSNVIAGVVNISFYLAVPLGKRTELLAEPYFKVPVKEIGWGNVDLYSSGFQFVLRYNFISHKKI